MDNTPCYIYKHSRDGVPFYIGIGTRNTRKSSKKHRNKHHLSVWNKSEEEGTFLCEVVFRGTRTDCLEEERRLIKLYGRKSIDEGGILTNWTPGGDGGNTWNTMDREERIETHRIISTIMWEDEEYRKNHSEGMKKSRKKLSESQKRRFSTPESRKEHSERTKRSHLPEEERKRIYGEHNKGRKWFHNPDTGEQKTLWECPEGWVPGRSRW